MATGPLLYKELIVIYCIITLMTLCTGDAPVSTVPLRVSEVTLISVGLP